MNVLISPNLAPVPVSARRSQPRPLLRGHTGVAVRPPARGSFPGPSHTEAAVGSPQRREFKSERFLQLKTLPSLL